MKEDYIALYRNTKKGFTLIELLVSIAIMSIILGITFSGGPQATTRLTLADNASQVELLIREAQLQGSAINSVNDSYGGVGVFFSKASSSQVLKFRDIVDPSIRKAIGVGNGLYEATPIDEAASTFKIRSNHRIGTLCVATSTSGLMCNTVNDPPETIDTLTISFSRPKQIAHIYVNSSTSTDYTIACVQIDSFKSPAVGYVKSIYVYRSGMITKTNSVCN
jgi:prepilin-type N-terminal cleavage/methylation domain-containing protein